MHEITDRPVNIDPLEVAKFDIYASRWWDTTGEFRTLHDINPVRLAYIDQHAQLAGKHVIDVGCGGGVLSEAMAKLGAKVIGIDASEMAIGVAKLHQIRTQVAVSYSFVTPEEYSVQHPGQFDVVTCMEMLEHVPRPEEIIKACARLVKPGGKVFLSTLNRTAKCYGYAVLAAEYLLNLLPKGTHNYARFIRPAELAHWLRNQKLEVNHITGMSYNPFTHQASITASVDVNYMLYAVKR